MAACLGEIAFRLPGFPSHFQILGSALLHAGEGTHRGEYQVVMLLDEQQTICRSAFMTIDVHGPSW